MARTSTKKKSRKKTEPAIVPQTTLQRYYELQREYRKIEKELGEMKDFFYKAYKEGWVIESGPYSLSVKMVTRRNVRWKEICGKYLDDETIHKEIEKASTTTYPEITVSYGKRKQ